MLNMENFGEIMVSWGTGTLGMSYNGPNRYHSQMIQTHFNFVRNW